MEKVAIEMEEAYGTASLAVSRLVCDASGDRQYLESEAALRDVLRRRPVVLGYVVSTLASKLRGEHCLLYASLLKSRPLRLFRCDCRLAATRESAAGLCESWI